MYRSWLFVPGDSEKKIIKGLESQADAVIIDWEDGVASTKKAMARTMLCPLLDEITGDKKPALYLRINELDTPELMKDLSVLPVKHIDGVVLPKACGPQDINRLNNLLIQKYPDKALKIIAVATENAKSVLTLSDFKEPVDSLTGIMWGAEDLAADMGVLKNRTENGRYKNIFNYVQNMCVLAATATKSIPIDAVCVNYKDSELLINECRIARSIGFTAKAAIHPVQVDIINREFTPDEEEVKWAQKVLKALGDGDIGVASVDGKMVDAPHLKLAKRILQYK